jgi:hypothetical protein
MVIKGKCRGNGSQLAEYLLRDSNDRAEILEITGTTNTENLKRSLLEMSLTAVKTKSQAGLYHAQINPDPQAPALSREDWLKSVDILAKELGLEEQRRAVVLHEKNGRTHAHIVFERYQEGKGKNQQGILWNDDKNYRKHEKASRAIEQILGHERTPQKSDKSERKSDHKKTLSDLWAKISDPASFIQEAQKLGYIIAQGEDRRPYKVLTPDGQSLDLTRQLDKVKAKDVAERLNPFRNTLRTEKEALQDHKRKQEQPQPVNDNKAFQQVENLHKLKEFNDSITQKADPPPLSVKWNLPKVQHQQEMNNFKKSDEKEKKSDKENKDLDQKAESLHKFAKFKASDITSKPTLTEQVEQEKARLQAERLKREKDMAIFRKMTEEQRAEQRRKDLEEFIKQQQQDRGRDFKP